MIFKSAESTVERQRILRRWVIESFVLYGVTGMLCLAAIGHISDLIGFPDALAGLADQVHLTLADSENGGGFSDFLRGLSYSIIPVLLFGHTAFALARTYASHKNKQQEKQQQKSEIRDIDALFPRNRQERFWTTLISINAGFSEEIFFRLLAPILFWIVTGSALFAVIAAILWFGMCHFYQGWAGIVITAFLGTVLMYLYIYTGSIWLVILIHAILDLNDLSFAPWFEEWLSNRPARSGSK